MHYGKDQLSNIYEFLIYDIKKTIERKYKKKGKLKTAYSQNYIKVFYLPTPPDHKISAIKHNSQHCVHSCTPQPPIPRVIYIIPFINRLFNHSRIGRWAVGCVHKLCSLIRPIKPGEYFMDRAKSLSPPVALPCCTKR